MIRQRPALHSRPRPSDTGGLVYAGGIERDGMILAGKARSPVTGEDLPDQRRLPGPTEVPHRRG